MNQTAYTRHSVAAVRNRTCGPTWLSSGMVRPGHYRARWASLRFALGSSPSVDTLTHRTRLHRSTGSFMTASSRRAMAGFFQWTCRRANVGILIDERTLARHGGNFRALFSRWLSESRFAKELLGARPAIEAVRGGVIPSGRRIRTTHRIFLIGDAAGVADPFTAEGIFQAMQSARMAARSLIECTNIPAAMARYEHELHVFDQNDRAARALRATFNFAIEPYARHAAMHRAFGDRLNTDVFFMKKSFPRFVWGLARAW